VNVNEKIVRNIITFEYGMWNELDWSGWGEVGWKWKRFTSGLGPLTLRLSAWPTNHCSTPKWIRAHLFSHFSLLLLFIFLFLFSLLLSFLLFYPPPPSLPLTHFPSTSLHSTPLPFLIILLIHFSLHFTHTLQSLHSLLHLHFSRTTHPTPFHLITLYP
jgi:hypothetical protein